MTNTSIFIQLFIYLGDFENVFKNLDYILACGGILGRTIDLLTHNSVNTNLSVYGRFFDAEFLT